MSCRASVPIVTIWLNLLSSVKRVFHLFPNMSDKFFQKPYGTNDTVELRHALASLRVISAYLLCSMALLVCCRKASFVGGILLHSRSFLIVKRGIGDIH